MSPLDRVAAHPITGGPQCRLVGQRRAFCCRVWRVVGRARAPVRASKTPPLFDQAFDRDTPGELYSRAAPDGVKDFFQGPTALCGHRDQACLLFSTTGDNDFFTFGCPLNKLREFLLGFENSYRHLTGPPGCLTVQQDDFAIQIVRSQAIVPGDRMNKELKPRFVRQAFGGLLNHRASSLFARSPDRPITRFAIHPISRLPDHPMRGQR